MADDRTDAPIESESAELSEFDPSKLPLGTFAAFDVSDQPLWTDQPGENQLTDDYRNAIRAMTDAAAKADSVARRIEVQGAWLLELLDRGFHRLKPTNEGGWQVYGSFGPQASRGIYGNQMASGFHDTNVIGEKNDIIVACLTREVAESTFFPGKPGNPDDEVYASTANALKYFIAEENQYAERQAEVGRFFCTDEAAVGYTRPVADAQRWGYADAVPDVVPETEDGEDPDAEGSPESKRPKIRTLSTIFGKLCRKVPIIARSKADWQYAMLAHEIDISLAKSKCPWVADKITAGDLQIAELKLDRLARQSICLAMQSNFATGDSLMRDVTETYIWFRPGFYMDDSCPKVCRQWFWENFEKGMLACYEGGVLAWCRNESMDEVLTEFHARTGNGQNRRAITESYGGPQMRLNVLVDLRDDFCRKTIPRVGLDAQIWNVGAIRASSQRAGIFEPFIMPPGQRPAADTILRFPVATGTSDITAFIEWLSGPLAEQLTHAQPALAASEGDDPETLGQSKLQNNNAMASFGESWKNICHGFANMTTQAVAWNARVQPETETFDSNYAGKGRITAEIAKLKMGSGIARADGTANFPESWADRQMAWEKALSDDNPMMQQVIADPRNLSAMKEFAPRGMVLPGVDSVEKQQGEFDVLLKTNPQPNPDYLKLKEIVQMGTLEMESAAQQGQQPDPAKAQALQQGQQMLQSMPPMVSSVPVRPTDNDAVEALVCLGMINSPVGRRLASSKDAEDQAHFQNLMLHWQQHDTKAKQTAAQNQKPIPPKTSITVAADKLPPDEQASALQVAGVAANPASIQQNQALAPHEVTTTEKGIGPSGSEIERKTSVVGKQL